ncbi:hypothetical protein N7462_001765 [Penicillium macrosclerotiorum]|uniref:uncharacterized protein n=1 Tax=Penicillium macrosclerotiorum TaxID=303699 RepID=UPI002548544A|nr:uncharacterized protein N7462_001765 [Penicillium macrosclerotiorum]KAJ5692342.1 hypothetical protein N7462_001765 [Penicillium macrosclerotiorum]
MDDDYVAQVLANEARDSSQKYSTEGLGAYLPRKTTGNAPKPNTRFLRHLIKETDSHNTALKHKEEREARERMRQLKDQSTSTSTSTSHSSRNHDRPSRVRDSERDSRHDRSDRDREHRRRKRSRSTSSGRHSSRRHRCSTEGSDRARREHRDRKTGHSARRRHETSRSDRRAYERSYSRSPSSSRSRSPRRDHASRQHLRSKHDHRVRSPTTSPQPRLQKNTRSQKRESKHEEKGPSRTPRSSTRQVPRTFELNSPSLSKNNTTIPRQDSGEDSDPLEDLVGPLPPRADSKDAAPVRSRGRGAYKPNASNIDAHFAPDYNPALDVQLENDSLSLTETSRRPVAGLMTEEDDWDMALEALRDRARWRQKGEDRLRAAGMNEDTIDRWKSNAAFTGMDAEGRVEDVRWSKKGEGREWDRGKVMDDEGHIDVRATW